MRKAAHEIVFFACAFLFFAFVKFSGMLPGAIAAPGSDVRPQAFGAKAMSVRQLVRSNPDNFMELDGEDVRAAFAQPGLVRTDLPSVMWQYRSEACVLDIYFLTDKPDVSKKPVSYYEVRSRNTSLSDKEAFAPCMQELLKGNISARIVSANAMRKSTAR